MADRARRDADHRSHVGRPAPPGLEATLTVASSRPTVSNRTFGIVRTSSGLAKLLACNRGTAASLRDDGRDRHIMRPRVGSRAQWASDGHDSADGLGRSRFTVPCRAHPTTMALSLLCTSGAVPTRARRRGPTPATCAWLRVVTTIATEEVLQFRRCSSVRLTGLLDQLGDGQAAPGQEPERERPHGQQHRRDEEQRLGNLDLAAGRKLDHRGGDRSRPTGDGDPAEPARQGTSRDDRAPKQANAMPKKTNIPALQIPKPIALTVVASPRTCADPASGPAARRRRSLSSRNRRSRGS